MKTEYIDIAKKWGIVVLYDYDERDNEELLEIMQSFGMDLRNAYKSLHILSSPNTGMAISNSTLRMSAIFISRTTSASEWWDTCLHELTHVADTILDYYGESWHGEPSAYLVGYMTKELVNLVGEPCK